MKALAGWTGMLVGLLIVGGIAYLARPYLMPGRSPAPAPNAGSAASAGSSGQTGAPQPDHPVAIPSTEEERLREELFKQRVPYFKFLTEKYAGVIERFSVPDDHRTLDLVVTRPDETAITGLVEQAVAPSARQYGFRRVRFFMHSPAGSTESLTLVAETTCDGSGRWNTFMK
jgi:hypothetical protein